MYWYHVLWIDPHEPLRSLSATTLAAQWTPSAQRKFRSRKDMYSSGYISRFYTYECICMSIYNYVYIYICIYILYIYIYMYPSGKWWLAYLGYHCYPTTCHLPSDRPRTCNWFSVFQIHKSKVHAAGAHACSHDEFPRHRDIRGLKKLKERLWELRGNGGCLKIWTKLTSNFFDHFPYCHEMGNLPTVQKSS